jgi:hypothetical protein
LSHLPERNEKNCLNCGADIFGKFCHICGQENLEPKESIWHLLNHFINDVTHFDGKFFSSLNYLITRPGFLSKEYMVGRRASYLNPIRMYLFTSAIFFLVFFSVFKNDVNNIGISFKADDISSFYKSRQQYDSLLKTGARNDNWLMRKLIYKSIELNSKYENNTARFISILSERFIHLIPQMLFFLLPMFALILKLIYRRKKDFYYTDHLIFTLHFYIFIFIALMVILSVNKLKYLLNWDWLKYISGALTISIFFYFYKCLRSFYEQRRGKTILKYFMILFLVYFIFLILYSSFLLLSIFQI